jgi:hypothetical protein
VLRFEIAWAQHVAPEDAPAKARREPLDLGFDACDVGFLLGRPVDAPRAVGIGPGGVPPGRRARRVGERLLSEQEERTLGQSFGA